jgi:PKD repeat protein
MRKLKFMGTLFALSLFTYWGCKKDRFENTLTVQEQMKQNRIVSGTNLSSYVTYKGQYQMLEFADAQSFNAVADLFYNTPVVFDRGNKPVIKNRLDQAELHGYTNGNNPNQPANGPVILQDFSELLDDSYPLSDEVLNDIIETNMNMPQGFPNNFLSTVFMKNVPLSEDVRTNVENSNFSSTVKNIITNADDNKALTPDYNAKSLLAQLNFSNSLLGMYRDLQETALKNGVDPESDAYPRPDIADEFLLTVLNESKEVKIGPSFYVYTPCGLAEIQNADFAVVQYIRTNGTIPVAPEESRTEPLNGYPVQQIEALAPEALIMHDVYELNNGTLNTIDNICSKAFFGSSFVATTANGGIKMNFINSSQGANLTYAWNFGDGYGSYAENPSHAYSQPGYYTVKLTVWGEDCCKSTYSYEVRAVAATCAADFAASVGSYPTNLSVAFTNTSSFAQNVNQPTYSWNFGDGSQTSSQEHPSHLYATAGTYNVCLTITVDNCTDTKCKSVSVSNPTPPDCCDLNDRDKHNFHYYDNNNKKIEYKIFMTNFGLIYHAMGSKTENYRKKSNGNWTHDKADVIHASWGGIPYHKGDGDCIVLPALNPGSTENNKKTTSMVFTNWGFPANNRLGAKQHSIQSQHYVKFNGQYIYTPILYLTEDCD